MIFRVSGFLCIWTFYEHYMYVSHIHVWVCYIRYQIYTFLFLSNRVKSSVMRERQTDEGTGIQTAISTHNLFFLNHTTQCYLQEPTLHFFCFSAGTCSIGGLLWYIPKQCNQPLKTETHTLTARISRVYLHISFHISITWLLLLILLVRPG